MNKLAIWFSQLFMPQFGDSLLAPSWGIAELINLRNCNCETTAGSLACNGGEEHCLAANEDDPIPSPIVMESDTFIRPSFFSMCLFMVGDSCLLCYARLIFRCSFFYARFCLHLTPLFNLRRCILNFSVLTFFTAVYSNKIMFIFSYLSSSRLSTTGVHSFKYLLTLLYLFNQPLL